MAPLKTGAKWPRDTWGPLPYHNLNGNKKCERQKDQQEGLRWIRFNLNQDCRLPSLRIFLSEKKLRMKLIVSGCWQNPFALTSNKKTWSKTASCIRATCWAKIQPNVGCHSMSTPTIHPSYRKNKDKVLLITSVPAIQFTDFYWWHKTVALLLPFTCLYLEYVSASLESFWRVDKVNLVFGQRHLVELLTVRLRWRPLFGLGWIT